MALPPPRRARQVSIWQRLILIGVILLGSLPSGTLLLSFAPARIAVAAGQSCSESIASSYIVRTCITSPFDGDIVSGTVTVPVDITAVRGTLPAVTHVQYSLSPVGDSTSTRIATDLSPPYTMDIPTARWIDGNYSLEVSVEFEDEYSTVGKPLVLLTLFNGVTVEPHSRGSWRPVASDNSPLHVVAVGDGGGGRPGSDAVGTLATNLNPDLFLYLGDVYEDGTYTEFLNYYEPTLGALRDRTNPIPGNHETFEDFAGYMDYWDSNLHFYSFDAGGWHFIALNNTIDYDQTAPGSPQYEWLADDLANSHATCTMVMMHYPRHGLRTTQGNDYMQDMWSLMNVHGVDIVLAGHEHNYQRWHPLDENGQLAADGIREYVVGSGGHSLSSFDVAHSGVAYKNRTDGVLSMTLTPTGASTSFISTSGQTMDQASFECENGDMPSTTGPDDATPTPTQTGTVVNTGGQNLHCRAGASTDDPIITLLAEGETVVIRGPQKGDWIPVTCDGRAGYVSSAYIMVTSESTDNGDGAQPGTATSTPAADPAGPSVPPPGS